MIKFEKMLQVFHAKLVRCGHERIVSQCAQTHKRPHQTQHLRHLWSFFLILSVIQRPYLLSAAIG